VAGLGTLYPGIGPTLFAQGRSGNRFNVVYAIGLREDAKRPRRSESQGHLFRRSARHRGKRSGERPRRTHTANVNRNEHATFTVSAPGDAITGHSWEWLMGHGRLNGLALNNAQGAVTETTARELRRSVICTGESTGGLPCSTGQEQHPASNEDTLQEINLQGVGTPVAQGTLNPGRSYVTPAAARRFLTGPVSPLALPSRRCPEPRSLPRPGSPSGAAPIPAAETCRQAQGRKTCQKRRPPLLSQRYHPQCHPVPVPPLLVNAPWLASRPECIAPE
jgi:hypothetical protein